MSIRLYTLAKELEVSTKSLLELAAEEGIEVRSHASSLTDNEAGRLRARYESKQAAEAAKPPVPPVPAPGAVPPPLPPRGESGAQMAAPLLFTRRKPPPQRGVRAPGEGAEEGESAATDATTEPAAVAEVPAPAAETAEPEVVEPPVTEAEPVAAAAEEDAPAEAVAPSAEEAEDVPAAPVAEEPVAAESPEAATAEAEPAAEAAAAEQVEEAAEAATAPAPDIAAEAAPEAPKVSHVDDFRIEVPKALGRIDIKPKEIPARGGRKKKDEPQRKASKAAEDKKAAADAAHPQGMGVSMDQLQERTEAGRRAREAAERTLRKSPPARPAPGAGAGAGAGAGGGGPRGAGLNVDTNRPMAGRSASGGGRRPAARREDGGAPTEESEEKKIHRTPKRGSSERRSDKVEIDADVDVIGTSHVRLERGEKVRRGYGERRRRRSLSGRKRADEAVVKGETVEISEPVTVKSFCSTLGVQSSAVIGKLMQRGMMVTVNEALETPLAIELALEFGVDLNVREQLEIDEQVEETLKKQDEQYEEVEQLPRAPIVTFMGHVDHGKTSLMDYIRKTKVVEGESGGITQHIGAYRVQVGDQFVSFLDTPGHQAFTAMRARGANVTDIVVLVVAADDGVMPQTEEAINHAKAAGVPIVVAMNKIDRPESDEQRLLGQLSERELVPEEWGGKTIVVRTSAMTGQGIDDLLESLLLESELLELKSNPTLPARGTVIEAEMREGLGPVSTVLVQDGTLRVGDIILAGTSYGRVRSMTDDQGKQVMEAGPSMPVRVSGLTTVPNAGDNMYVLEDLQEAREYAEQRERKHRELSLVSRKHTTLEELFEVMQQQKVEELSVIVKADVQGSVEVLRQSLNDLQHPEVRVQVIHTGIGAVNESDVLLADASDAVIIGFHVITDERARALSEQKGVDIRTYSVIYQVVDDLRKALEGMLRPETKEQVVGHLVVRSTFKISRIGTIAGCYVTDGTIRRNSKVRLSRQGVVIHEGRLDSLKRFKDDVREVSGGMECGLKFDGFDDVKTDDLIESIETIEIKRTL